MHKLPKQLLGRHKHVMQACIGLSRKVPLLKTSGSIQDKRQDRRVRGPAHSACTYTARKCGAPTRRRAFWRPVICRHRGDAGSTRVSFYALANVSVHASEWKSDAFFCCTKHCCVSEAAWSLDYACLRCLSGLAQAAACRLVRDDNGLVCA